MNTDVFAEDTWTKWTYFSIGGHGGYFLADGFEIGPWVSLYLENASATLPPTPRARTATRASACRRDTSWSTGTRFIPFVQLLAAYRMCKDVDTVGGMTISENSWSAVISQLRLGLEFMLNDSVGLVAGTYLQYSTVRRDALVRPARLLRPGRVSRTLRRLVTKSAARPSEKGERPAVR